MKPKYRNQSGITLLEIMVTVVIVGIISAMAVPHFEKAVDRLNYSTAIRAMKSSIKVARSMSVSDKTSYGVYFNPTKRTYTVFKEVANLGNFSFDAGDSVITLDTLPKQFTVLSTELQNNVVLFRPNGSAWFGGTGNISATAYTVDLSATSTMSILASTGRIDDHTNYY